MTTHHTLAPHPTVGLFAFLSTSYGRLHAQEGVPEGYVHDSKATGCRACVAKTPIGTIKYRQKALYFSLYDKDRTVIHGFV
jgi:hypothetical protein